MLPYIIVGLFIIFFSSFELFNLSASIKKIAVLALFVVLVIFIGFRDGIGNDWPTYREIFVEIDSTGESTGRVEPGFVLLNKLSASLGLGFNQFVFVMAFLSIGLKLYSLNKISPKPLTALVFYLAYFLTEYEMSGMRQALAMSFAFLSVPFIFKRNILVFSALIGLGATIHVSILLFFPAYFLARAKWTTKSLLILLGVSVCLIYFNISSMIVWLVQFLPLGSFVVEKINWYASQSDPAAGFTIGHFFFVGFSLLFIFFRSKVEDTHYDFYLNLFLIGIAFSFLFSGSLGVLNRASYYYLIFGGVLFSYILNETMTVYKLAIFTLVAGFLMLKITDSVTSAKAKMAYIPYKSYLRRP